jgi:FtsP/CotA-like multicopper oxidase with cupredoxin domain
MDEKRTPRQLTRRDFLKLGGGGAIATLLAAGGLSRLLSRGTASEATVYRGLQRAAAAFPTVDIRLVATDGHISLPGRRISDDNGIYVFGFRGVESNETFAKPNKLIAKYKGKVTWPAPIIGTPKEVYLYLTLTNLGLVVRPDLDDSHTIHWHGFRNPNSVFDGVPEVSISVPVARDFPYLFVPRDEGTYMYHCHFEDVEHVQMGMDGVVYIEANNGNAYDNDGGITAFNREFTLLLNEVDPTPHDNLENVQEFTWSDYKADYWVINGRSYPDTVIRDQDLPGTDFDQGGFYTQPVSSLIQVAGGETALLRFANLGYEQQSMQLLGIPMTVVGQDASFLGSNSYMTNSVYIGPGEARDVLFTAPAYSGSPDGTDGAGSYDRYWLRNRNSHRLVNGSQSGLGGMLTEVRVYSSLPAQDGPNITI